MAAVRVEAASANTAGSTESVKPQLDSSGSFTPTRTDGRVPLAPMSEAIRHNNQSVS